uniref:TGB1 n=1 Tax=Helenium virus S TaxID=12171 RepID=A0A7U0MGX6_HELVS|nr:TGB1 [Helenium virus S]QQX32706.1 TGB1 [Helenium virus S]
MDVLVNLLCKYKFERLNNKLEYPIVVHCVPGAGKSSCIRELINADSRFVAYTFGEPDPPSLTGVRIESYRGVTVEGKFNVLDEYNLEQADLSKFFVVFGDPIQANTIYTLRADFICRTSRRFGKCTAQFLRDLGYEVQAEGEDTVQQGGLYDVDPFDTIVYCEEEVGCLLRRHNLEARSAAEVIGKTFESVTFVTSRDSIPVNERAIYYQCLTRHKKRLLVMSPNGTLTAT